MPAGHKQTRSRKLSGRKGISRETSLELSFDWTAFFRVTHVDGFPGL